MPTAYHSAPDAIRWEGGVDGSLILLDQTKLPLQTVFLNCFDAEAVFEAIRSLRVRGAPAIGIAAAYGVVLGLGRAPGTADESPLRVLDAVVNRLAASRPTAVNLFWALQRMRDRVTQGSNLPDLQQMRQIALSEARAIHEEDRATCHAIGKLGATLIPSTAQVLTHCNTGGLATSEYGTALGVFFTAQDMGKALHVYVDETRPLLQGARLTAWELLQRKIPATLICDSMSAHVMATRKIDAVFVGADRIAANGDTANKIGTYGLALIAKAHGVPFYVAAPSSTFDLSIADGSQIPIEERRAEEITEGYGIRTAPEGVVAYNPAFDVTPASLITAIVTEKGIISPVSQRTIRNMI
jgi:methylthioribose-1-phosphate isomerase